MITTVTIMVSFIIETINPSVKKNSHKSITFRSFKHFNEEGFLNGLILAPWAEIEVCDDVKNAWYLVFLIHWNCQELPVKTQRVKHEIQPDWLSSHILNAMKEMERSRGRDMRKNGKIEEYETLSNKITTMIKESKKATYKQKLM